MKRASLAIALAVFCALAWAASRQRASDRTIALHRSKPVVAWIFLDTDSARSHLPPAISAEAAALRASLGLPAFDNDRPVPPALVQRLAGTGAEVRYASRWLRAVSVSADSAALEAIRDLRFVRHIQLVGRVEPAGRWTETAAAANVAPPASARVSSTTRARQAFDSSFYGDNWPALRALGVPGARISGFSGRDIRVAILDTGFDPRHESLSGLSVVATRDFVGGDNIVYDQPGDRGTTPARHGTQVWSILGGFQRGIVVGPAYQAQFILAKVDVEPGDSAADEDRWVAAAEWADSLAARVIASPLTFRYDFTDKPAYTYAMMNGDVTVTTRIADEKARRGIVVVNAIGDAGPSSGSLAAPADADSVIAVGAVDALGRPAVFANGASAQGPTVDARVKPEVVARGQGLTGASSLTTQSYDRGLEGTSYATALVAGAAAVFLEAWPGLSAAAVRRAFLLAGDRATAPDNALGFGTPDVAAAILFPDGLLPGVIDAVDTNNNLTVIAPLFSWQTTQVHPQMRPVRYTLQIARDAQFTNVVYSDTIRESNSLRTRVAIRPASRLWWRVSAETINLPVRRFSPPGDSFAVPGWVRLVSPDPNQVTETELRPELVWQPLIAPPPIGPLRYDVEIFANSTGRLVQSIRNLTTAVVRVPEPLVPNTAYRWRVIARTQLNEVDTAQSTREFIVDSDSSPPSTLLYQNFPNPFPRPSLGRSDTQIWFDIDRAAEVELSVLDLGGRLIRRLIPAHPSCGRITLQAGVYGRGAQDPSDQCRRTNWDGTDSAGRQVAPGVYLLRLRTNGRDLYRRMVFLPQS
jgi:hypothetical protein